MSTSSDSFRDLHSIWRMLEAQGHVRGSDYRVYETDVAVRHGEVLLAIDQANTRHLLIPVDPNVAVLEDRKSQGVHVVRTHLNENSQVRHFVDLVCRKDHLGELFAIVVSDILKELSEHPEDPDRRCRQILNRWRELFDRGPRQEMSLKALTGLFGELWVLRELCFANPDAVQFWRGPLGDRFDFRTGQINLEVKATLRRHGWFFEIHGHEQLSCPAGEQLFLIVIKLEEASGAGGIADVVAGLRDLGCDEVELAKRLALTGYDWQIEAEPDSIGFRVLGHRMYRVDEDFPAITEESFSDGRLPPGVLDLTYTIDLTGEPPVPLAQHHETAVLQRMSAEQAKQP